MLTTSRSKRSSSGAMVAQLGTLITLIIFSLRSFTALTAWCLSLRALPTTREAWAPTKTAFSGITLPRHCPKVKVLGRRCSIISTYLSLLPGLKTVNFRSARPSLWAIRHSSCAHKDFLNGCHVGKHNIHGTDLYNHWLYPPQRA